MDIYIYTWRERDRERGKDREGETERHRDGGSEVGIIYSLGALGFDCKCIGISKHRLLMMWVEESGK